jgi:hypothetical protein
MYKKKPLQVYRNGFSLKLFYEKTKRTSAIKPHEDTPNL